MEDEDDDSPPAYWGGGYTQHTAGAEIRAEMDVCLRQLDRFQALRANEQDIVIHEVTHRAVPLRTRSSETLPPHFGWRMADGEWCWHVLKALRHYHGWYTCQKLQDYTKLL